MSNTKRELSKIAREIRQIKAQLGKTSNLSLNWKGLMSKIDAWKRKNQLELGKAELLSLSGGGMPGSDETAYIGIDVLDYDDRGKEEVVDTIMITADGVAFDRGSKEIMFRNPENFEKEALKVLDTKVFDYLLSL